MWHRPQCINFYTPAKKENIRKKSGIKSQLTPFKLNKSRKQNLQSNYIFYKDQIFLRNQIQLKMALVLSKELIGKHVSAYSV